MTGAARKQRQQKEWVDGLLLLNKPAGITSNRALQTVKRLLNARKAGHTGSLDPAATGMLPLCFGEATKVCAFLLDADKTYRVTARLGIATDTGDADGKE
ncbi:MAG: tRNA pseudouridine(55) synthase TruB, partial [Gammaproteobacteria bacterium]|nr:tRNA pseudouridine(55) synthase TruB [Gammaproteobacteria bacterium]